MTAPRWVFMLIGGLAALTGFWIAAWQARRRGLVYDTNKWPYSERRFAVACFSAGVIFAGLCALCFGTGEGD